jgi:uncharacterized protein YxeA
MKQLIIGLIALAIVIVISLLVTQAIVESDMPLWLKIWFLRR